MRLKEDSGHRLLLAAMLPAFATILAMVPYLTGQGGKVNDTLLLSLFVLPVMVAFGVNTLWPAATTSRRALLTAGPQLLLVPGMLLLGVWAGVQRGDYAGGGLDMELLLIVLLGPVAGLVLMLATAAFARLGGAWAEGPCPPSLSSRC